MGRLGGFVSIHEDAAHFRRSGRFRPGNYNARNFHFGIREHAMGAIVNGMVLSKLRAYGSTFLIFSDYMKMPSAFRRSWKSVALDLHPRLHRRRRRRTTHQPIEQLITLRAIPGLITLRPADANEVVEAWKIIMHLRKNRWRSR